MYALYKQALQDPPIEKAENPGTFDLKGKAKKRAWQVRLPLSFTSARICRTIVVQARSADTYVYAEDR